jgi:ribonuclease P protein component
VLDCEVVSADTPSRGEQQPAPRARNGFPRTARLLKHSDFERVYKQGRRHFSPHMTVFYWVQPENTLPQKSARVGFTVGRPLGGAVERNRIKRRLREAVRLRLPILGASVDVVINPKKSVLKMDFAVLVQEIERAFGLIAKKISGTKHF